MNFQFFNSFVKEAIAIQSSKIEDAPNDYLVTKVAAAQVFPGLRKIAAFSPHVVNGLEVGGLGILAAHGVHTLRDPKASSSDKKWAGAETAGLGVLAAHPAYELGHAAVTKLAPKLRSAASLIRR